MINHAIVSHEAWVLARKALLAKEKEFTRAREALSRLQRELPWERVTEPYAFDTEGGRKTLSELFAGRSQLVVYHLMYGPNAENPCRSCSFWADNLDRNWEHLGARDVTLLAVSRGPLERLLAFKKRLGWTFEWVSSAPSGFNYDYQATLDAERGFTTYNYASSEGQGERPGISVFFRESDGSVFHTYSTYERGIETMNAAYAYLDVTPKGRDEDGLSYPMAWVKHRDVYGVAG